MSNFCEIPSSSRLSSPWRFFPSSSAMIASGPHLPVTTSKTSLAPHPGSSTQGEWALSFVFTVLLGHLLVSMALQSKYLCVRTPNTTIPCGQRNFSREVDHEHR